MCLLIIHTVDINTKLEKRLFKYLDDYDTTNQSLYFSEADYDYHWLYYSKTGRILKRV